MPRLAPAVTLLGINYPPEPTGISPYTGAMAVGLARDDRRIAVVTAHPHYPEWSIREGYGQWSRKEHLDGLTVTRLRHYVPARPTGVRRLASEISFGLRLIGARWQRPDAIVLISPALFSSALAAVRARTLHRRAPLVVWVQDLYTLGLSETGQGSGVAGRLISAIEGWLLRRADKVVVIHERFASRVCDDFSIPRERVEVIRNWTHLPAMPAVDRASARLALGWGDETVVLHAGNMGVKQGLENVLAAARLADRSGASIRFVLMGNGGEKARLVKEAAGITALQFLPPLPDVEFTQALIAADVLLVNEKPGVAEMAVPSKLTSYFSTGRPVLAATDESGITAEEVATAEAGVIVPAGDPSKLLEAALSLGKDSARSTELGANGLNYRNTVLNETFAIDRFATLLSLLIDGDGSNQSVTHQRPSKFSI